MLHAAFVLGNRLYGAGLFARYGHIDDGMVGAVAVADAATDADYAENIVFLLLPFALQGFAGIFGQRGEFVGFVGHVETHQRERFVFPHGALLVYAAATQNP